ncbi:MAG: flippase-like domain-containing protein [Chloroflexi bacterium]|nr:flippase-like domain-containing protein [Chloroflexota bacterium]
MKSRIFSVPTLLSFVIAMGVIALLATRVDLDWGATWDTVRGMNPWLYVLGFLLYYASFVFRGMRWRLLAINAGLRSSPDARLPSTLQCSQLILIGWFINSIAGLRLGDAYRTYAFSEDSKGGFSWSLGTVLAERALDMVLILGILVVSATVLAATSDTNTSGYILAAFAMAVGLAAVVITMKMYGVRLARLLPNRIEAAYQRFHQGALGSFKQLPILAVLGLAAWFLEIARLYLVIRALDLDVALALVPVVALGHALLSIVPTPGGVGAVEPGMTGLLLLSLEPHEALSVTLVDRSITYVSIIVIGGLVFLLRQVMLARQRRQRAPAADAATQQEGALDS